MPASRAPYHPGDDAARADALGADGAAVELARSLADFERTRRQFDHRRQLDAASRLATAAQAAGRPSLHREALHLCAKVCEWDDRPGEALAALARLEAVCRAGGFRGAEQVYGATALVVRARFADPDEASAELDPLLRAARAPELAPVGPSHLLYLASALCWVGRDGEARALAWEAGELALRQGQRTIWLAAQNNVGICDWLEGRWGRAAERFAAVGVEAEGFGGYRFIVLLNLATVTRDAARFAELGPIAEGNPHFLRYLRVRRLVVSADEADWHAAREVAANQEDREALGFYRAVQLLGRGEAAAAVAAWRAAPPRLTLGGRLAWRLLDRELRRVGVATGHPPA